MDNIAQILAAPAPLLPPVHQTAVHALIFQGMRDTLGAILKRDQGPKRRRAWARIQSEPEFVARRFGRLVIGSGDHGFIVDAEQGWAKDAQPAPGPDVAAEAFDDVVLVVRDRHGDTLFSEDGSTIDDCELVSAGRRGAPTLWVHDGSDDRLPDHDIEIPESVAEHRDPAGGRDADPDAQDVAAAARDAAPGGRVLLVIGAGENGELTARALSERGVYPVSNAPLAEAKEHFGGYLIVDDYQFVAECQRAVDDFRRQNGIDEPLERVGASLVAQRR